MQIRLVYIITILCSAVLFYGCAINQEKVGKISCGSFNRDELPESVIDFDKISKEIADNILTSKIEKNSVVLVTEFVDLTTLRNNDKFGFLITNYVKNQIVNTQKKIVIYEVDMASSLKIGEEGMKLLTRKAEELSLSQTLRAHYAIIGTYTKSPDRVFLSVHLVNLKTQVIEEAFTKDFPMSCETKTFFN